MTREEYLELYAAARGKKETYEHSRGLINAAKRWAQGEATRYPKADSSHDHAVDSMIGGEGNRI